MNQRLCIGSYAAANEAGIYIAELEPGTGRIRVTKEIRGITKPSFVLPDRERQIIYAVEQKETGAVAALDAETGEILARVSSGGVSPCHLALNEDKTLLSVCNYASGSIGLVRLDEKGLPRTLSDVVKKEAAGQHPVRQTCSHMHFSAFRGSQLFACDLGANTIYRFDVADGQLRNEAQPFQFPPAVGPRHFVMKGERICVITEMGGSICVFNMKDGRMLQEIPLLDATLSRETLPVIDVDAFGAAIRMTPDGRFLLASVRGTDELQLFRMESDGLLSRSSVSPCGGRIPRDAEFCGRYALAANQESDSLCVFAFDEESGKFLGPTATLSIRKPTCIQRMS